MKSEKKNETTERSQDSEHNELLDLHPLRISHTPIIVTDGSAAVEFQRAEYTENTTTGEFAGSDLRVSQVEILDRNSPNNDHVHICGRLDPSKRFRVTVICAGKDFEVTDLGGSVKIRFDRTEYPEITPAPVPSRRKFRQSARRITGLIIEDVTGTIPVLVHRCRLVPGNGSCQVTIFDSHI